MAGKGKLARDAISGLSDIAQRWFNSLDETTGHRSEILAQWPEFVDKVKSVAEEAPFAFSQYEPKVLRSAIAEAAEGIADLAVIKPENFRMLAARNIEYWMQGGKNFSPDDPITKDIYEKINEYADMYESGIKFDDIPRLHINQPSEGVAQVIGHEGRHRVLGQEKIGSEGALIRILRPEDYDLKTSGDILHTEVSIHQPASEGGGKSYKPTADVLKFLSLGGGAGALSNLTDEQ
jgi:hypothetical protein